MLLQLFLPTDLGRFQVPRLDDHHHTVPKPAKCTNPLVEIEADLFTAQMNVVHRFIVLFNVCSVFLEVWNCQTSGRTLCSPNLSVQLFFSSVKSCLTWACDACANAQGTLSVTLVVTQCMTLGPVATERCYSFLLATS